MDALLDGADWETRMSEDNWSEQAAKMTQSWMDAQRTMWQAWADMANSAKPAPTFADLPDDWQKKALEVRARVIQKQKEEAAAKNPLEAM